MTMGLPFSHIAEHEVFPQTFLHKVEARFHYRSDDEDTLLLHAVARRIADNIKPMDADFSAMVDREFWDLF